jgi:hypothetical protein
MGPLKQFSNGSGSRSQELDLRLSRSDARWMINDMDWTPESLPVSEDSSLTRDQFAAAIARFNLHAEVDEARQRSAEAVVDLLVDTADATLPPDNSSSSTHDFSDTVVVPRVDTVEESLPQMELESESETEKFSSDSESHGTAAVEFTRNPITPGRGPPSADPVDVPDSKRRRPRSCFRHLTSPVMRQAATFAADGTFEDYDGKIFARASSVLFPSLEMILFAVLQLGQSTLQGWLLSLTEVRQLTTCSKRWAGERPRCLSLQVLLPDVALVTNRMLKAMLLPDECRQLTTCSKRWAEDRPRAYPLATMEWIPSALDPISDKAPSSVPSCTDAGPRQGSLVQDRLSGCGVPFALHDLPGRYDGVGVGRSNHTQTIGSMERVCESDLQTPTQTTHTIVSMENERCLSAHVRTWLCGSWLLPGG